MSQGKIWELRKKSLRNELEDFERRSAVLEVLRVEDLGDELRAVIRLATKTLVKDPRGGVEARGPVVVGVRYHERFLSEAPVPYEIATIVSPRFVFHPNVSIVGALCLGHPPPGLPLGEILHMIWAALVFNLRVVNTTEWQGFQPEAAVYVRANRERFPLTLRGLLEPDPAKPQEGRQ